jgi:tripartite-type tricarboxylate transporter receptor subunit TctC
MTAMNYSSFSEANSVKTFVSLFACVACLSIATQAAKADPIADFYKGKRITMTVGGTSGGGYAVYARAMGQVLPDYIPGHPNIIVQYQPGASTIRAANYIYNVAKRDGSEMGAFQQPVLTIPFTQSDGVQYDPAKFAWLGSLSSDVNVCLVRSDSGLMSLEEAKTKQVTLGANAPSASSTMIPTIVNHLMGTKFKIISGYNGPVLALAIERGEVQGHCTSWSSVMTLKPDWVSSGFMRVLVQLTDEKLPDLPNVPTMNAFGNTPDENAALEFLFAPQKLGRPYAFPLQVPADRLAAMRDSFAKAMNDPKTKEIFDKEHLDIDFTDGARMQERVTALMQTPKKIVDIAAAASKVDTGEK